jgi:hypothetical protein
MKTIYIIMAITLMIGCSNKSSETRNVDHSAKGLTLPQTKSESVDSSYVGEIIFGRFCGECIGNCAPMFRLNTMGNATTLWADYENNYFKGNGTLEFATDLNQRELIDKAYQVMWKLPKALLNAKQDEKTFGCPDCTDGCGIYIEFMTELGGKSKIYRLDWGPSDSIPKEITDYADFVDTTINEIMK